MARQPVELVPINAARDPKGAWHPLLLGFRKRGVVHQLVYIGLPQHPGMSANAMLLAFRDLDKRHIPRDCECGNFIDSVRNRIGQHLRSMAYANGTVDARVEDWVAYMEAQGTVRHRTRYPRKAGIRA